MQVTLQYAEAHLADLVSAACRGEEVEIAQPDQPTLKLVVSAPSPSQALTRNGKRILGAGRKDLLGVWEGKLTLPTDEEWNAMDKEIEDEMVNNPLFPPEHV